MTIMSITRMLEQNVYFFLVSGLTHGIPNFSSLPVVNGFPKEPENILLPSIGLIRYNYSDEDYELSSSVVSRKDRFKICCFCERDGQRDDIAERIREIFDDTNKDFLDFNQGFSGGQASLGKIYFDFINMNTIRDFDNMIKANEHRMDIEIEAEFIYDIST